jgi:hypothetical protein
MKPDEAFNPIDVGLLGADAVMLHTQPFTHLIEQFGRLGRSGVFLDHCRVYMLFSI